MLLLAQSQKMLTSKGGGGNSASFNSDTVVFFLKNDYRIYGKNMSSFAFPIWFLKKY